MRLVFFLLFITAQAGCSNGATSGGVPEGDELALALRGAWCVSEDGGKTCWGYERFLADNVVHACGVIPEINKAVRLVTTVWVTGTQACYVVVETSDPKTMPLGHRFCVRVRAINDREQTYEHLGNGKKVTTYRVADSTVKCPSDA